MGCPKHLYSPTQESSPFLEVWKKERLEKTNPHFYEILGEKRGQQKKCVNYYPFGLTFNSWHVSPENKYKFQGQEHQDETGWDSFKWRNHDPALGRFFNVDPLAEKFYYNSPYAFSENKVTAHIELEGLEAWDIKNEWDEETIKKYEEFAAQKAAEYESNEVRCTCEDLALNIMIDFASENQLPLQITNNSGENGASVTLDAASEDYSDVDGFRNEVLSTTGANDLSNGTNTVDVSKNDLKKGDMLLFVNSEGRGHHTQVVTFTTPGVVNINQGNFDQGGLRQSSDPNFLGGAGYIGAKVQRGTYDRSNGGKYYNHSTGGQRDGLLNASGVRGKRWNFFKWNKK